MKVTAKGPTLPKQCPKPVQATEINK